MERAVFALVLIAFLIGFALGRETAPVIAPMPRRSSPPRWPMVRAGARGSDSTRGGVRGE